MIRGKWKPVACCLLLTGVLVFAACGNYEEERKRLPDNYRIGSMRISADESFKPVIDAQVQVYQSNNPSTRIYVDYKPEAECLKDMLTDSVRMIIATRKNTEAEKRTVADSFKTELQSLVIARDAIAVIANPQSEDSFLR